MLVTFTVPVFLIGVVLTFLCGMFFGLGLRARK